MSGEDNNNAVLKAKIEWYREILLLEPNSKTFLPFARHLREVGAAENNPNLLNEAFDVLRRGLLLHPDFMEARLFHIELLNSCGCQSQCGAEVARLASLFLSYPDFWDAWREYSILENESSDFSVALGFMGAILKDKTLSIVTILEAGLTSLRHPLMNSKKYSVENKECKDIIDPSENPCDNISLASIGDEIEQTSSFWEKNLQGAVAPILVDDRVESLLPKPTGTFAYGSSDDENVFPESHIENYKHYAEKHEEGASAMKKALANLLADTSITVEPMNNSSFRTRSMAEVLFEQGDLNGAIEIYRELCAKASDKDALSLRNRLSELEISLNKIPVLRQETSGQNTSGQDTSVEDAVGLLAIDDLLDTSFGLLRQKETIEQKTVGENNINKISDNKEEGNNGIISDTFVIERPVLETNMQNKGTIKSTKNAVDLLSELAARLEAKAS